MNVVTATSLLLLVPLVACGGDTTRTTSTPTAWADVVDNPWFPLVPGTRSIYRSTGSDGPQRIVVTVTHDRRTVDGVEAVVVHDRVTAADGSVVEDTFDWYAQDADGNVWYLGEDTTSYDGGGPDKEGSWEAGVDGAEAGIIMRADPKPGDSYRQEYYEGEAEDRAKVLSVDAEVTGPMGSWTGVLQTEDMTPLEPDLVEHKFYVWGVGVVEERDVSGGDEHVVLVRRVGPTKEER